MVPDLKRQFTEAKTKYREAQAAQQQHQRVTDLEHEVAWAHMKVKKAVRAKTLYQSPTRVTSGLSFVANGSRGG